MSQLETRGIEVGPRWLGVEDTQETDLIGMERVVVLGSGAGEKTSVLVLPLTSSDLSSFCF